MPRHSRKASPRRPRRRSCKGRTSPRYRSTSPLTLLRTFLRTKTKKVAPAPPPVLVYHIDGWYQAQSPQESASTQGNDTSHLIGYAFVTGEALNVRLREDVRLTDDMRLTDLQKENDIEKSFDNIRSLKLKLDEILPFFMEWTSPAPWLPKGRTTLIREKIIRTTIEKAYYPEHEALSKTRGMTPTPSRISRTPSER